MFSFQVVVILGKEKRMFAKSTFAIIISDSLTFLVDKPKLAVRSRAGKMYEISPL